MNELQSFFDDHFRHRHARIVARLVAQFGASALEKVEDALQESLMRALRHWPLKGLPKDPDAWLIAVARNILIDKARRQEREDLSRSEVWDRQSTKPPHETEGDDHQDEQLRLIFTCCHPALSPSSRVALTLQLVCGFGQREVARALMMSADACARRLSRAKGALRAVDAELEYPEGDDLSRRIDTVLSVIYLMFNEGYAAQGGDDLIRRELINESLRLGGLMLSVPRTGTPAGHALVALMLFLGARTPARIDDSGNMVLLADQDRGQWKKDWIRLALQHLQKSATGSTETAFHLEAAIASLHSAAEDYESTRWPSILALYDRLVSLTNSPIARLNRIVAIFKVHGAGPALQELDDLNSNRVLSGYHYLAATRGILLWNLARLDEAQSGFEEAMQSAGSAQEKDLMKRRLSNLKSGEPPPRL